MQIFVGWPAERRNVIPPSLIGEYETCSCSRCDAELVYHEPTRKKHWDGCEIVCEVCAADMLASHDGPKSVRLEREKTFKKHFHRG